LYFGKLYNDLDLILRNFKGYLCFTAGTTINAIAGMLKKGTASKILGIVGSLISILGTFNFVKPFLIKEKID